MIKQEIKDLKKDIEENQQVLTWLNKMSSKQNNRRKRDLGGGFGSGPPIYGRRLPQIPPLNQGQQWAPPIQVQPNPGAAILNRPGMRFQPSYDDYDYGIAFGTPPRAQNIPTIPKEPLPD